MSSKSSFFGSVHQSVTILLVWIAILGILAAIFTVKWVVLAALVGVGLGTLVIPLGASMRERFHIPLALTSVISLLVFFGAFLSVGYFIGTLISEEITPVLHKLPNFIHSLQVKFPMIGKAGEDIDYQKMFGGLTEALVSGLRFGVRFVGGLVFLFFIALYFSIQPKVYEDGFISAFPGHMRGKVRHVMEESAHSLRRWFYAQLLAMFTVAVVAAAALKGVGSPYWLFFSAIVFVLELIPYFGPITAFVTVCVVTAAGDPDSLIKTAVAFVAVLSLEGHVIIPLVMRGRAHLPPVHLLIVLTAMGEWFGVFGFLMAAPTLMVLRTVYQLTYLPEMDKRGA